MLTVLGHADASKLISSLQLFERATRDGFDREVNTLCCALLQSEDRETDPRDPLLISREVIDMRRECRETPRDRARDRGGWEETGRREDEEGEGSSLRTSTLFSLKIIGGMMEQRKPPSKSCTKQPTGREQAW
uniref:Uncharacterized protein n=1 Tax=Chromera velia CCMP2878 TaxID=1169474 RepID=A0A0G4I5I4_9ALVE|eukprot:Cvel_11189.t1-p1 / transcript=Cvel_11189.t1 / gene=Cvel_11189 / organism=Chromera_velia_CCMP2878 / gene_product=hypothetical protein / transcript_product=hypothetical protein / location=Cvel_scaffold694:65711-66106(-) / protein_length=132 / sequence_SO=supercontig / SO=protein_coding / is_pseudo=false